MVVCYRNNKKNILTKFHKRNNIKYNQFQGNSIHEIKTSNTSVLKTKNKQKIYKKG